MKYIIDLNPDCVDGGFLRMPIRVAGEDQWIKTKALFTPYTEPDRKAIEDEVWSLAREIAYCMSLQACEDAGMVSEDDIYDSATGVLEKLTYQEAKARYDDWKKGEDKIRVGDEVTSEYGDGVVLDIVGRVIHILGKDGICNEYAEGEYAKTGRHFDEVEELLKKMKGES
jgi:hypothetical protein